MAERGLEEAARGRVALIVGGGSGMGRLAAQRWSDAGGIAVAADIDDVGLKETVGARRNLHVRRVDVTDAEAVRELVDDVERNAGPIERVYNAAAIQPTGMILDQELDTIHRIMAINYGGVVNVTKAALPRMLARKRGSLINFASIAGWVPNMHFGAYSASKFAVVGFTECLYHENRGKGVHIACVCPGQVDTPLRAQATSNPRIMQVGPKPVPPALVIDAIERAIARGSFWVFPGFTTRMGWYLRRFVPWVMWQIDHNAEGV
jgi:NAD(P)-dependent dehydrogenase (short-subunit alcohol dehydrogenase family)